MLILVRIVDVQIIAEASRPAHVHTLIFVSHVFLSESIVFMQKDGVLLSVTCVLSAMRSVWDLDVSIRRVFLFLLLLGR